MSVIGRFDRGDSRWYVDPADPDLIYESVTAILSAANSKPWLGAWQAKLAAEFAVHHLELVQQTLVEAGPQAAIDLVKGAANRSRDLKADIGSHQHDVLEALLLDLPIPDVPEHLVDVEIDGERVDHDAISDGLLNFITDFDVEAELAEATVVNPMHGYAGTLDLIAFLRKLGMRLLIDAKTGLVLDKTMRAQLAAYRRATEVWVDDMGNKARMPQVDGVAVLHIRREYERGYKLLDQGGNDDDFGYFLECQKVLRRQKALEKVKGRPIYPPLPDGSQPLPLIEDLDEEGFNRCRSALIKAGVRDVSALAALTIEQVSAIKGIGPKSLPHITTLLAEYGLTYAVSRGRVA